MPEMRCIECAECHDGECDETAKIAFIMDCALDALDEALGLPPEPGSRRWLIERGEYPPDGLPTKLKERGK